MKTYGKSIVAVLGALVLLVIPMYTGDHHIDPSEGVAILLGVLQAVGVWLIPLAPQAKWAKTGVALLTTLGNVFAVQLLGGIDGNDVAILITAVLTFFGIAGAGAISPTPAGVPDVVAKAGLTDS